MLATLLDHDYNGKRNHVTPPESPELGNTAELYNGTVHRLEPIAIIGMSCRLPGSANDLSGFWEMIRNGRTAWAPGPGSRFNMKAFQDPSGAIEESTNVRGAHFLKGDISAFDASFFGINALEAAAMDPQHRLLLEIAYQSFENAGITMDSLWGSETGVYVGQWTTDYHEIATRDIGLPPKYLTTGTGPAISSNRISYFFNLRGPSFTVDTGCSSSLVALHQAIHSLRSGETSQCFVGGVNLLLDPQRFVYQSKLSMFSKEGRSFSFDNRANGYGRGEGCTGVVIKTLSEALRDGDNIRAVIRNSSVTQDGRTPGITVPSAFAQTRAIRTAYQQVSLVPQADYIEAHGTGTKVGDPIEVGAIATAFDPKHWSKDGVPIGSVKANIGHTEAAAGLAGLIKAVLMLENEMIPPQANYKVVNPNILLDEWHIRIPTKLENQKLRRISVNSFGYGGTNAHVIVDHVANALSELSLQSPYLHNLSSFNNKESYRVFFLSAASEKSCQVMCQNLGRYLIENCKPTNEHLLLSRLARTLEKRSQHPYRLSLVASNSQDLVTQLMTSESLPVFKFEDTRRSSIAFVFSGQGAQYAQMGCQLRKYPRFQQSMEHAKQHLFRLGCSWDLLQELNEPSEKSRINEPEISQPSCTAIQLALVDLLADFGILPHAVIGHSSGEIAAAYAVGAASFENALAISYFRGKVTSELLADDSRQPGSMLAVGADTDVIEAHIKTVAQEHGQMRIACFNSPRSCTVSGDSSAIDKLKDSLDANGYFNRKLKTNGAAYHSHHMQAVEAPYANALMGLTLAPPSESHCRLFSTVHGMEITDLSQVSASYWAKNLLSPVLFTQAVSSLVDQIFDDTSLGILLEIGPHSQLGGPVKQIINECAKEQNGIKYMSCLARGKDSEMTLLQTLSQLHIQGISIPLHRLNRYNIKFPPQPLADLPPYPFDHEKTFWHESRLSKNYRHRRYLPHELLGTISPDLNPLEPRWRHFLSLKQSPWLKNHVIQGQIIFPAAAYLTMAMEAAKQYSQLSDPMKKIDSICLRNVSIGKALLLSETGPDVEVVLSLRPQPKSARGSSTIWNEFRIFSASPEDKWSEHCRGLVQAIQETKEGHDRILSIQNLREVRESCSRPVSRSKFYHLCRELGIDWQEPFDNLSTIQTGETSSFTTACATMGSTTGGTGDFIHPSTLDSILFQSFFAYLLLEDSIDSPAVPTFIQELRLFNKPKTAGKGLASTATKSGTYTYNVVVQDADNLEGCVIQASGVTVTKLPGQVSKKSENLCFKVDLVPYVDNWDPQSRDKFCKVATLNSASQENQASESKLNETRQGEDMWQLYSSDDCKERIGQLSEYCHALAMQTPRLKILTVGTGAAVAVRSILPALNGRDGHHLNSCDITGISVSQFESLKDELGTFAGVLELRNLDIAGDLSHQGFEKGTYDIIFASYSDNDAETSNSEPLSNLGSLLKPGSKLIILALAQQAPDHNILSRISSKEACERDDNQFDVPSSVALRKIWKSKLEASGFSNAGACFSSDMAPHKGALCVLAAEAPWNCASVSTLPIHIVTTDCTPQEAASMESQTTLIKAALPEFHVSVHSLNTASSGDNIAVILPEVARSLCLNPDEPLWLNFRTWLVKARVVLMVSTNSIEQSHENAHRAIWTGLSRSIRQEFPHIRFITMDFQYGDIFEKLSRFLPNLFRSTPVFDVSRPAYETENEFTEVDGQLYIPRVRPFPAGIDYIERMQQTAAPVMTPFLDPTRCLTAELEIPGLLETIRWKDSEAVVIGDDELRIELRAASINFKDVLIAAGQLPGITAMRNDCSGIVLEVGAEMRHRFKPGDCVLALYSQSYTNYPVVHGDCCEVMPDNLSFDEAAGIPIVWATVYYSLVDMGRLAKGDKVLIHSGAGAVGQAAIMLAQHVGAEVFTTVSGEGKRQLLHDRFNISHDHIFSSRTTEFYYGIKEMTNDYGVDVVLNSLSGEIFRNSCNLVARFGRFVEIGRKELMDDSLMPMSFLLKNITFSYVDMALIIDVNKPLARRILHNVVGLLAQGSISPVSITSMPISDIETAFRTIQSGKHTGKMILNVEEKQEVKALPPIPTTAKFQPDATYAVVGGFGGIGRAVIEWMADNGAQHIVSITRSGATSQSNRDFIEKIKSKGVNLIAERCNVACEADVVATARRFMQEDGLYPIRGVVQSSVVFDDGLFEQMSVERWWNALGPKVQGTKNLDLCFRDGVDFFVVMSSIISISGNDGQTNYSAACCFQDELVRQRAASGLHAFSMNIGPVKDVGWLSERLDVAKEVQRRGFGSVSIRQVLSMLNYAIMHKGDAESSVCAISPAPYSEDTVEQARKRERRFAHIVRRVDELHTVSAGTDDVIPQLGKVATFEAAVNIICGALLRQLGRLIATQEQDLSAENSLDYYGVDSLIAVEMRNWIMAYLQADLSLVAIRGAASIRELAKLIAKESPLVGLY